MKAPSQLLGAPLGSDVQLECQVEASPLPVSYWLKGELTFKDSPNSWERNLCVTISKGGRVPPNGFIGGMSTDSGQPRPEMLLDGYVASHAILSFVPISSNSNSENVSYRPKYGITEERSGFRGTMKLVVRKFSQSDVGTYHCVSTNSLGRAEGTLRLYGKWYLQCPQTSYSQLLISGEDG